MISDAIINHPAIGDPPFMETTSHSLIKMADQSRKHCLANHESLR